MLRFSTSRLAQLRRVAAAVPVAVAASVRHQANGGDKKEWEGYEAFHDDDFFWLDELSEGLTDMGDFLPPDAEGALRDEEISKGGKK